MAETTIHADFERLRRSMDAMSEIHEATLKSMLDGIRESRDEFLQAYHEFKEGLRQDFREFRAGIKQKSEIESDSLRSSSPLIPCPQLQIDRDLRREIPATGSTIPVVTGTTPDPIRFEKPAVDSKIEASPGMQFNFSGVTRVAKHDFPRMVDDIVELAFDGCIGNTQIFDPGGIDGVNDCGECLQSAFDFSIQTQGYDSHYQGVYPVKCKQDRFIVEDIVEFGSNFRFGLEAGSKPEILLAMSCLCKGNPEALLVCNGLKDAEYISLALLGRKLALNTMIVFEQEEELDLVISEVYELVNMLLSQDVCSKKEKSALKEAKSLVNEMLGYMSVCSSNSLNEESTEEVGFSVSIGDLARVWTGSNSELGSFFPLVSDDICKKMNEEDFSVNYLAGVVLLEATLSRTVPIINGDIRSHERVSFSFSDFIRICKQHMRSKGNGSLVEAKSSCLTPMPDFPIPADHEPGQIARKLCLIFNGWFHLVDSDDLTIAVNFWWESNIMSNMAEHMDSYYLRRITRSLIDREMSLLVSKTSSTDLKQLSANIDQSNTGQAEGVNDISSNESIKNGIGTLREKTLLLHLAQVEVKMLLLLFISQDLGSDHNRMWDPGGFQSQESLIQPAVPLMVFVPWDPDIFLLI